MMLSYRDIQKGEEICSVCASKKEAEKRRIMLSSPKKKRLAISSL